MQLWDSCVKFDSCIVNTGGLWTFVIVKQLQRSNERTQITINLKSNAKLKATFFITIRYGKPIR